MAIVIYFIIPIHFLAIILAAPFVGFSLALAFYKINSKPFVFVLEAAISYFFKNKLYIWKKIPKKIEKESKENEEASSLEPLLSPRLSDSRLKDLAWSLDINDRIGSAVRKKFDPSLILNNKEKDRVEFQRNYDIGAKSHT